MATYQIKNNSGVIINTIEATEEFMASKYSSSQYSLLPPDSSAPAVQTIFTQLDILNSFPLTAIAAILSLVKTDVNMEIWYLKFTLAKFIDTADPDFIAGIAYLKASGILPSTYSLV